MAGVIRDALDAHPAWWWTPNGISTEVRCTGPDCDWTASAVGVQPRDSHRAHQAEVATTAVLEAVEWVLDGWLDEPQASRAMRAIEAALAGEG